MLSSGSTWVLCHSSFFPFPFAWNIFFHPLTFSMCVSLGLKWISYRLHIYRYCFFFFNFFYFLNFKIFNSYMRSQTWTPLPPPSPFSQSASFVWSWVRHRATVMCPIWDILSSLNILEKQALWWSKMEYIGHINILNLKILLCCIWIRNMHMNPWVTHTQTHVCTHKYILYLTLPTKNA